MNNKSKYQADIPERGAPGRITDHGSRITHHQQRPWFREPWPWLLMAGPAAVFLAGSVTIWLAIASNDGLVADDYYKRGLAINQELGRDRLAAKLDIRATVSQDRQGALEVALAGSASLPLALIVRIIHPTRDGDDRTLVLPAVARGVYRSDTVTIPVGRRYVILGDEAGSWRLTGEWTLPLLQPFELAPRSD